MFNKEFEIKRKQKYGWDWMSEQTRTCTISNSNKGYLLTSEQCPIHKSLLGYIPKHEPCFSISVVVWLNDNNAAAEGGC